MNPLRLHVASTWLPPRWQEAAAFILDCLLLFTGSYNDIDNDDDDDGDENDKQ